MDNPGLILIFASGLIAFVPNASDRPDSITALLLNGEGAHVHEQTLRVTRGSLVGRCPYPCSFVTANDVCYCQCPLKSAEVTIEPPTTKKQNVLPPRPEGLLPSSSNSSNIAWLPRMRNLDPLFSEIDQSKLANFTGSKISFGWERAATCAFDEYISGSGRNIFAAKFIQAGKVVHEQSVAEMVVFEAVIPNPRVKLKIKSSVHGEFELELLCTDSSYCPVALLNFPRSMSFECNDCGQCIYGSHFAEYWKLTGKSVGGGAVPRRECGVSRVLSLENDELCPNYRAFLAQRQLRDQAQLALDKEERSTTEGAVAGEVDLEDDSPQSAPCEEEAEKKRPKRTAAEKVLVSTLIEVLTLGERIICPMTIIEP